MTQKIYHNNACFTHATTSNLAAVLPDPKRGLHHDVVDVGAKSPSLKTTLADPALLANEKTSPSYMGPMEAAH